MLKKKRQSPKKLHHYLMILCPFLVVAILIIAYATTSTALLTQSNIQPIGIADSKLQFELDMPYIYVGKGPANVSYIDSNGLLMTPESQYPSAIYLNITQLPKPIDMKIDAKIEVYSVKILTDKGSQENYAYFAGTNYNSAFSQPELESLTQHIYDVIDRNEISGVSGDFNYNWTENTSILSHSAVGSIGHYSNSPSKLGLWSSGEPNIISVTVNRLGYITMTQGSISVYKDAAINTVKTTNIQCSAEKTFFQDTLIPVDQLSQQRDLFHPIAP